METDGLKMGRFSVFKKKKRSVLAIIKRKKTGNVLCLTGRRISAKTKTFMCKWKKEMRSKLNFSVCHVDTSLIIEAVLLHDIRYVAL